MFVKIEDYIKENEINEKFEKFEKLLIDYNAKFNLTSITEKKAIQIKHFEDSIQSINYINNNSKVIEIGSGGGFPSVPLKIINDSIDFTLVESVGKKCEFLKVVKKEMNFDNFNIVNDRCEIIARKFEYREKFDIAIARAVASLNTLSEYLLPFVKLNGFMIAYKGDESEEIELSKNAIQILGGKIEEISKYELSENFGKRSLVIIRKIANTPEKYPRGNGKERSKPL